MPLLKGRSNIGRNYRLLRAEGRPRAQALAIALRTAGVKRRGNTMSKRKYKRKKRKLKMTKSAIAARRRYRRNKRKYGRGRR